MYNLDEKIPFYSIFILFLIVSAAFITEIFPCKVRQVLTKNMYVKHFFALLTMIFFVVLSSPLKDSNILDVIFKSLLVYIIFIFATKTHYIFFIIIIIFLGLLYVLIIKKGEINNNINDEKNEIEKYKLIILSNNITLVNNIIFILTFILIIIGFFIYYGQKKYEYKKNFNFFIFLFGKSNCSYKKSKINMINSLIYAFTK
jgi:hypothetical protein